MLHDENYNSHLMLHDSSKFDMQMCREPVAGLEVSQELLSSRTPKTVGLYFLSQELLLSQQLFCTSIIIDSTRPVMAHENVYGHLDLKENYVSDEYKSLVRINEQSVTTHNILPFYTLTFSNK